MSGLLARRWLGGLMVLACFSIGAQEHTWLDGGPGLAKLRITNDVPVIYSAVRIEREYFHKDLTLITTLASNTVVGTQPLSNQLLHLPKELGTAVAAMNADFFMMSGSAKGDPRGLHIWNGELVSVATGPAAFWMDAKGSLHGEPVRSKLTVEWKKGERHLVGLNEELGTNSMVLFTPTMGVLYPPTNSRPSTVSRPSTITRTNSAARTNSLARTNSAARTNSFARATTRTTTNSSIRTNVTSRTTGTNDANTIPRGGAIRPPGGREWVLEHAGDGPWLPLRIGHSYRARVVGSSDGFTNVPDGKMILMAGSNLVTKLSWLKNGTLITINAATEPDLTGQQHALGTGPMLVRNGKLYEVTARMSEQQHPRAAIGWNDKYLFFAVSDGRRKGISEGIKLSEMAEFMIALGCDEAINMDGGQSTTLMLNGEIINAQTPGGKHEVANAVVVLRKPAVDDNDVDK